MSDNTEQDRHPIPAEIIEKFSNLETAGDCSDLVLSGYADAMIQQGYFSEDEIKIIKSFQAWELDENEKEAAAHYRKYYILGADYEIPEKHLHTEFKQAIKNIDTSITIKNLVLIVYPINTKSLPSAFRERLQKSLIELVKEKKLRINDSDQELRFLLGEMQEDEFINLEINMLEIRSLKNSTKINKEYKKYYELWWGFYKQAQQQADKDQVKEVLQKNDTKRQYQQWNDKIIELGRTGKYRFKINACTKIATNEGSEHTPEYIRDKTPITPAEYKSLRKTK